MQVLNSIGWGEVVVLALAALFIFGPERLPDLARDAAGGLKRVRGALTGMRGQLHESLGPEFDHLRDVDLRRYHPRSLLREHLIGSDDGLPGSDGPPGAPGAGRAPVP